MNWKGGIYTSKYIGIRQPNGRYKMEHIIVMENHLGRALMSNEVVHHIDENKHNNSLENLQLMTDTEHRRHHALKRAKDQRTKRFIKKDGNYYVGRGVSYQKAAKKWESFRTVNHKKIYLGLFKTEQEALEAKALAEANNILSVKDFSTFIK